MCNIRKPKQPRDIGSEGFILDDKYLLSFSHFDGHTYDLLNIDLFIDRNYRYELFFSSLGKILDSTGNKFETYLEGKLPDFLKNKLAHLLSKNLTNIKSDYTDFHLGATDGASQVYALNAKSEFRKVMVGVDDKQQMDLVEFKIETTFFEFNRELNLWLTFLYEMLKKANSWPSNEEYPPISDEN